MAEIRNWHEASRAYFGHRATCRWSSIIWSIRVETRSLRGCPSVPLQLAGPPLHGKLVGLAVVQAGLRLRSQEAISASARLPDTRVARPIIVDALRRTVAHALSG